MVSNGSSQGHNLALTVCVQNQPGSAWARRSCTSSVFSTYRGTSLIRNSASPGPHSRNMPRALWWSWGGGGAAS